MDWRQRILAERENNLKNMPCGTRITERGCLPIFSAGDAIEQGWPGAGKMGFACMFWVGGGKSSKRYNLCVAVGNFYLKKINRTRRNLSSMPITVKELIYLWEWKDNYICSNSYRNDCMCSKWNFTPISLFNGQFRYIRLHHLVACGLVRHMPKKYTCVGV
jgi:hypothetical protein